MFGCTNSNSSPKVLYKSVDKVNAVVNRNVMILNEKNKKELIEQSYDKHKIKVGDKLIVDISGYPELSTSKSPGIMNKTTVNQNGNIQLPELGLIYVLGMTTEELGKVIAKKLQKLLLHPDVIVSRAYAKKNRYYLLGEFVSTKSIENTDQMTLLEVLAFGGGIKTATADLRHAYVVRNKKKLPVNLYRLIEKGDLTQNIDMRNRDTVVIPNNLDQFVYIFAMSTQATNSKIPLLNGNLTLTKALSMSEFLATQNNISNLDTVYIVRTENDRIETFAVDAQKMFMGKALPFNLVAGDVIYIPKSPIGNINTIISYIFPTLELINSTITNIDMYRNVISE